MKRFFRSRWFRIPFFTLTFLFAAIGFFLTASYFAIQYGWTKDSGKVDVNTRYFQSMSDKYNQGYQVDSATVARNRYEALDRILILNSYHPTNAEYILSALQSGTDEVTVLKMLDAADLQLKNNRAYQKEISKRKYMRDHSKTKLTALSVYDWMNISEWQDFKIAVAKDRKLIDSVGKPHRSRGKADRFVPRCRADPVVQFQKRDL